MKNWIKLFIALLSTNMMLGQQEIPSDAINGTYHLMTEERGVKIKFIQLVSHKGTTLLAIAPCEKCVPAMYTYQEAISKKLNTTVFLNSLGLYVIPYNKDSFITVLATSKLGESTWSNFAFSNFYSKSKTAVNSMNKENVEAFAIAISKKAID